MKSVMVLVAALALSACSLEVAGHKVFGGGDNETKSTSYHYQFSENGCDTGQHDFSSHDDYCNGLKNDSLNRFCAITSRYNEFKANCGDKSWNN